MQLDFVTLGMLAMRRFSGYDLRKWMDGPLKYIGYDVQLPQIYRRLGKLVERGWVTFDVEAREGGPDAKLYRMTDEGIEALWEWARSPYVPPARPGDSEFVIRFIFGGQLDPEIALSIVTTELEHREKDAAPTGAPSWADRDSEPEPQLAGLDVRWATEVHLAGHEYGFAAGAAYIAWLKLLRHRLERRAAELLAAGGAGRSAQGISREAR